MTDRRNSAPRFNIEPRMSVNYALPIPPYAKRGWSRLLDQGVDIVTVKELLGHSTVLVTMRYLHPNLEAKVQAVAKLAADCDNPVTVRPKVKCSS